MNFLTNDELKNRHICAAHFSESSFHQGNKRCRLLGPAIPLPFQIDIIETTATNDHQMEIGKHFNIILKKRFYILF